MKSLRTLLANVKVEEVKVVKGEEKMDAREVVLGAKFESGVAKANAVIGDVIAEMCGETLAMEEAMEKALAEKAERIARRAIKIEKAKRTPLNKRANGIVTPKAPQNNKEMVEVKKVLAAEYAEKFLNSCNGVSEFFRIRRIAETKKGLRMDLTILASGSASTGTNNDSDESEVNSSGSNSEGGSSEMKMNLQLLARKITPKMAKEMAKLQVNYLAAQYHSTNNVSVVAHALNKVVNQPNGLTPLITVATQAEEMKEGNTTIKVKDTSVSLGLMMRGRNRFNRFNGEVSPFARLLTKYPIGGSVFKYTEEDFLVDEFIVLKIDSKSIDAYADRVFYVDLEKGIFAVQQDGEIVNLINKEVVRKPEKLNQYMFLGASASALREKFGFYGGVLAKTYDVKTGARRSIKELVNDKCDGLMDRAEEKYTELQASKFCVRHMQYDTSSISLGYLGRVAKLNGVFDASLINFVETETGVKINFNKGNGTFDGLAFMPVSVVAEMFRVTEEVAQQLCLQARPGSLKVQIQALPDDVFYTLIKMHKIGGNIETFGEGKKISLLFDKNAQKAKIDLSKLELEILKVITKKPTNMSMGVMEKLVAETLLMDYRQKDTKYTNYLGLTKILKEIGVDGVQNELIEVLSGSALKVSDLNNASAICNKGINTIAPAITGEVKNTLRSVSNGINKLNFGEGMIDYLTITTDMGMLFGMKLLNEGEIYIPGMKKAVYDKDGNIVRKRTVSIKYPTMGMNEFYSGEVIPFVEMKERIENAEMPELFRATFKDDAEKEFNKLKKALIRNYRNMSDALVVLPASMKVFNSCAGLDVDTDAMAVITDERLVNILFGKEKHIELGELKSQKEGVKETEDTIMADNSWEAKKAKVRRAGGVKGQRVAMYDKNKFVYKDDANFFSKPYKNATNGKTESIGSISNSNSKIIALFCQVLLGRMDAFKVFFKENFGTQPKGSNKKYVGLEKHMKVDGVYYVDEDVIDAIMEEAKVMDINNIENALTLLSDLNQVFRFYQEKTIDMAKTGGSLTVRISTNSIVLASLTKCDVIDIDKKRGSNFGFIISKEMPELKTLEIKIRNAKGEVVEEFEMNQVVVKDTMALLQNLLIEEANRRLNSLVSEYKVIGFQHIPTDKGVSAIAEEMTETIYDSEGNELKVSYYDMTNALERAHYSIASKDVRYTNALYVFKKIYNELAKQFAENTRGLDAKEDEALINAYRDQFKSKLAWIANSCELILTTMVKSNNIGSDYVRRGMIMTAVAAKTAPHTAIVKDSTNKFALNVCEHYTKCYALNTNVVKAECNVIECDESLVGQTVELVNGMSADLKLVVKDKFKSEKVKVKVVKDDETNEIKVLYTERIEAITHDSNKASLIFNTEIVDAVNSNGEVIVDASGTAKKTTENVVLAEILKGEYETAKMIETEEGRVIELTKVVEDETVVVTVTMESESFNDMELDVVYNVGSAFLAGKGEEGLVAVELVK